MISVTDVARIGMCCVIAALAGAISDLVTTEHAYGFIGGVVAMVVLLHITARGSLDQKDDDRFPLFAGTFIMIITVAGLVLIGFGFSALFHWIAG